MSQEMRTGWMIVCLLATVVAARGQGTISLGFETEPVGSLPAYVRLNSEGAEARVADAFTFGTIPVFEGRRYLWGAGAIFLTSPNGEAIKEFSLAFLALPNLMADNRFLVGGQGVIPPDFHRWITINGSFTEGVPEIAISAFATRDQETFSPAGFALDNVVLKTVPEPSATSLILITMMMLCRDFRRGVDRGGEMDRLADLRARSMGRA